MLKEAIETLMRAGQKAGDPLQIILPTKAGTRYLLDGKVIDVPFPVPPREHKAETIASLCELATRFQEDDDKPVIWVNEEYISLTIDDDLYRESRVDLRMHFSDVFAIVADLATRKPWFEQKPFVRMLRVELGRALPPAALLERVKRVVFANGSTTTGESSRTRESMGREINSRVETAGELPEFVTLNLPVFALGDSYAIDCSVDVDPARGVFQLAPLPDEIERVKSLALARIADDIRAEVSDVPVYLGRP
jgi:hypothetical protein